MKYWALAGALVALRCLSYGQLPPQVFDATRTGQSIKLEGKWLFHAGESQESSTASVVQVPGNAPNHSGVGWYSTSIQVDSSSMPPEGLALLLNEVNTRSTALEVVEATYEVYANGCRVGGWGSVPPEGRTFEQSPHVVTIPSDCLKGDQLRLDIKTWRNKLVAAAYPNDAGIHSAPILGTVADLLDTRQSLRERHHISALGRYTLYLICFFVALIGLRLFVLQPARREFLWFGVFLLLNSARSALSLLVSFTSWIDDRWSIRLWYADTMLVSLVGMEFGLALNGFKTPKVLRAIQIACLIAVVVRWIYPEPLGIWNTIKFGADILMVLTTLVVVVLGFRLGRRDAWPIGLALLCMTLPFISVVLDPVYTGNNALKLVMNSSFFVGPFRMQWHYPGLLLFAFTVAWVLTRRFTEDSHQREQLEAEVRAAKEVQDLLLAGSGPAVEGFAIDSAYLPAADLGGDFFQALPARDGGLLLVVGDVSGKGLRAAMLAGVVIGAIRTAVDPSPAALLRHLNGALAGRSGEGFVTCCVCLLRPDGELLVANAGHIPPYCDGKPIDTPGGLPLGIVAEMDWDQVETRLDAGRTLVLLSDGVLEATNSNQEMLGFDGLEAALATKPSASDLANLARNFGQEDDITVLAVSRTLAAAQVA